MASCRYKHQGPRRYVPACASGLRMLQRGNPYYCIFGSSVLLRNVRFLPSRGGMWPSLCDLGLMTLDLAFRRELALLNRITRHSCGKTNNVASKLAYLILLDGLSTSYCGVIANSHRQNARQMGALILQMHLPELCEMRERTLMVGSRRTHPTHRSAARLL